MARTPAADPINLVLPKKATRRASETTPTIVMCRNCGLRPGTVKWIGEGGMLALTHGFFQMWCEICTLEAQIAYAQARAASIPKLEADLARARQAIGEGLASAHNGLCTDREWLVITGLRLALAKVTDTFEPVAFSPATLAPFVAGAAAVYGYREGDVGPDEIHKALGGFFPGNPPRSRSWIFSRAMVEPTKFDAGLVGRFAADPAAIPNLPSVAFVPSDD